MAIRFVFFQPRQMFYLGILAIVAGMSLSFFAVMESRGWKYTVVREIPAKPSADPELKSSSKDVGKSAQDWKYFQAGPFSLESDTDSERENPIPTYMLVWFIEGNWAGALPSRFVMHELPDIVRMRRQGSTFGSTEGDENRTFFGFHQFEPKPGSQYSVVASFRDLQQRPVEAPMGLRILARERQVLSECVVSASDTWTCCLGLLIFFGGIFLVIVNW